MDNRPKKHVVTLIIDTNDNDESELDLSRYFTHHSEFQINQTYAQIVSCKISEG